MHFFVCICPFLKEFHLTVSYGICLKLLQCSLLFDQFQLKIFVVQDRILGGKSGRVISGFAMVFTLI